MNYSYLFRQPISTLRIPSQSLKFIVSSSTYVSSLCPFYISCQMNRTNLPINLLTSNLILSLFSLSAPVYYSLSLAFPLHFFALSVCGWLWEWPLFLTGYGMTAPGVSWEYVAPAHLFFTPAGSTWAALTVMLRDLLWILTAIHEALH